MHAHWKLWHSLQLYKCVKVNFNTSTLSYENKCKYSEFFRLRNYNEIILCLITVFSRDFRVSGRKLRVAGTWQSSGRRAWVARGVRGYAPPENFWKWCGWRSNLVHFRANTERKNISFLLSFCANLELCKWPSNRLCKKRWMHRHAEMMVYTISSERNATHGRPY